MGKSILEKFDIIEQNMRDIVNAIKPPERMVFDLDSPLLNTYNRQKGKAYTITYGEFEYQTGS